MNVFHDECLRVGLRDICFISCKRKSIDVFCRAVYMRESMLFQKYQRLFVSYKPIETQGSISISPDDRYRIGIFPGIELACLIDRECLIICCPSRIERTYKPDDDCEEGDAEFRPKCPQAR